MKTWWRRVRAAIGMGLIWAVTWSLAGGLLSRFPGFGSDLPLPLLFAPLGFISGILFSGILVGISGRRGFERASPARFAGLGAAGGLLLTGIFVVGAALRGANVWSEFLTFGPPLAVAGAISAAGSLGLARWVDRRDVSGGSGNPRKVGVTGDDQR